MGVVDGSSFLKKKKEKGHDMNHGSAVVWWKGLLSGRW
jgi:hypothetical protein